MAGEGSERRDAEDQVRAALEAMQGTALSLLRGNRPLWAAF
jgi:hypothetical protein